MNIQEACGYSATAKIPCPCDSACYFRCFLSVIDFSAMFCRLPPRKNIGIQLQIYMFFFFSVAWKVVCDDARLA